MRKNYKWLKITMCSLTLALVVAPLSVFGEDKEALTGEAPETSESKKINAEKLTTPDPSEKKTFREWFSDGRIAYAAAQALNSYTTWDVSYEELTTIESLHILGASDLDFGGIENLPNLGAINFSGSKDLPDLSPLQKLPELTRLDLGDCGLTSLDFLKYFPKLGYLNIENNAIEDLTLLKEVPDLKVLYFQNITATDFSPIGNLTKLFWLSGDKNQVTTLDFLEGLPQLEFVSLNQNKIEDLTPLKGHVKLDYLLLEDNQIRDVTPLSDLPKLRNLKLLRNQITDIMPLAAVTSLERLEVGINQITSVGSLASLNNLKYLSVGANKLTDASFVNVLPDNVEIWVQNNEITNISNVARFEERQNLNIQSQYITLSTQYTNQDGMMKVYNPIIDGGNRSVTNIKPWSRPNVPGYYDATKNQVVFNELTGAEEVRFSFVDSTGRFSGTVFVPYTFALNQTVTFDSDEASSQTPIQSVFPGESVMEPTNPTKLGYDFLGWFVGEGVSARLWNFQQDTMPNESLILHSNWKKSVYTVTYEGNGADATSKLPEVTPFSIDNSPILIAHGEDMQRKGYTFIAWNTAADGSGISYLSGENYDALENLVLYATWEKEIPSIIVPPVKPINPMNPPFPGSPVTPIVPITVKPIEEDSEKPSAPSTTAGPDISKSSGSTTVKLPFTGDSRNLFMWYSGVLSVLGATVYLVRRKKN